MNYIDNSPIIIPPNIKSALDGHAQYGRKCGSFVTAVLENDFMTAIGCADSESFAALRDIAKYVFTNLPNECHGSTEKVRDWRASFDNESVKDGEQRPGGNRIWQS